ncbi:ATP-binding protein [Lactococcus petauri]|nr:ATP-binding protein [Lactococcus petauri]
MLVELTIKNALSYKDENVLSMLSNNYLQRGKSNKEKPVFETFAGNILKTALVFGPNASGKSNLLNILSRLKSMLSSNRLINTKLPSMNFVLSETAREEPTEISIGFISDNKYYFYEIGFNLTVSYEILHINDELYFERFVDSEGNSEIRGLKSELNYEKILRPNSLLVYRLQDDNDKLIEKFYDWFENKLIILNDAPAFRAAFRFSKSLNKQVELLEAEPNKEIFVNFLKAADINVSNIEVVSRIRMRRIRLEEDSEFEEVEEQYKELMLIHDVFNDEGKKEGELSFPIHLESRGTQKLIYLLLNLIDYSPERVIIMDEFDDSFHLKLSTSLLTVFNSFYNKTQCIFTTHETLLMDSCLRRDQIYFVEKDNKGVSTLFSLDDFEKESRQDVNNSKKYVEGRFGAVPIVFIDDMMRSLGKLEGNYEEKNS